MPNVSIWEILLLLLVLLLVFGPKRLPEMGRSLGRGLREFKDSISGKTDFDDQQAQHAPTHMAALPTEVAGRPAEPAAAETATVPAGEEVRREGERA